MMLAIIYLPHGIVDSIVIARRRAAGALSAPVFRSGGCRWPCLALTGFRAGSAAYLPCRISP